MNLKMDNSSHLALRFSKINVSFIYGYVHYPTGESDVVNSNGFKAMLVPTYNLNCPAKDGFCVQNIIKEEPIRITSRVGDKLDGAKVALSACILRKTNGGPGSLTIKLSIENQSQRDFDVDTVLSILDLVPRTTLEGPSYPEIEVGDSKHELLVELKRALSDSSVPPSFSPIFRFFHGIMSAHQNGWNEYEKKHCYRESGGISGSKVDKEMSMNSLGEWQPIYCSEARIDPQIPYIVVECFLSKEKYHEDFMGDGGRRSYYTKEIGCLLSRWLNSKNCDQLNTDYYSYLYNGNDEIIGKNDSFISRYRDKKTFILFSSLLTLILKGDGYIARDDEAIEAANKAAIYTTNSVISYLEFSRVRLHNALWLNKQLDNLVAQVEKAKAERQALTRNMLNCKEKLNTLRINVAKSMNNPIFYMWDSVLGQEIPSLRVNKNVEKLEHDTIVKLNLISELITDKITFSQMEDFSRILETQDAS